MNKITNVLGIIIILLATFSVFYIEDIRWMDASFGIAAGAGLIYVKNNSLVEMIRPKQNDGKIR